MNSSKEKLQMLKEKYIEKDIILTKKDLQLPKFGFTDASLIEVAINNKLLLTDDSALFCYCKSKGIPSINLDTIKTIPANKITINSCYKGN